MALERNRAYADLAARVTAEHVITDPWLDGAPRLAADPLILTADQYEMLRAVGEAVTAVHDEAVRLCTEDPALVRRFYAFTPMQQSMWESSQGRWHGIARADVFLTPDGPRCCELNCDTPSGEAEAALLGAFGPPRASCADPNEQLGRKLCDLVDAHLHAIAPSHGRAPSIGILYPTEIPEDLSMIAIYRRWMEARGWSVTVGSPFNLQATNDGGAALFGTACDVFVRHYKTDWWTERRPISEDQFDYQDPAPLTEPYAILLRAEQAGRCAVVNPFGAVLPQNKRTMALMWEAMDRFPEWAQRVIRRVIPRTLRLEAVDRAELARDRDKWVLKSDYGCEGNEVLIARSCTQEGWEHALARAIPRHWIVQERFASTAPEINLGVYTIQGEIAGVYTRVSRGPTRINAISVPTLVRASAATASECALSAVMNAPPEDLPARPTQAASGDLEALATLLAPRNPALAPFENTALFHSVARERGPWSRRLDMNRTASMAAAEARGRAIASMFQHEMDSRSLTIVIDVPGPEAVAFAAGLADVFDPVFWFGNVCHEAGVVPAERTVAACLHYAPRFVAAARRRGEGAPAAFVYDANRALSYGDEAHRFDNRYWARLPCFKSLGVTRILYIADGSPPREPDDFNADFCQLQATGVEIRLIGAAHLRAPLGSPPGETYRAIARPTVVEAGSLGRVALGPVFQMTG